LALILQATLQVSFSKGPQDFLFLGAKSLAKFQISGLRRDKARDPLTCGAKMPTLGHRKWMTTEQPLEKHGNIE
jgi:hypothetical protein